MVAWSTLGLFAMVGLLIAVEGSGEDGTRAVIRATARTSLALFLASFVASSVRRLWRTEATAWWLRNRRYLGLSFAVSHFLHLGAIVLLAVRWPESFWAKTSAVTLWGGGIGYVLVAAMAATSSDAAVRALGTRRWKLLHRTGAWYLFGIFLLNYGPSGFFRPGYLLASLAVFAALGLRIAARVRVPRAVQA